MNIITLPLGELEANCYIVDCKDSSAVVIDPGANAEIILAKAKSKALDIKKILLTHGHFDHTAAADDLRKQTGAQIYIHKDDVNMLSDDTKCFAFFCPNTPFTKLEPDVKFDNGDEITQGEVKFRVLSTPGHSAGSVCFLCDGQDGENIMFSGDTLFKDSIGRSDGFTGDPEKLMNSLLIFKNLEKEYTIYPGHGDKTKLSTEKRFNPFLRF